MAVAIQHPVLFPAAAEPQLRLFTIDELEAMVRPGDHRASERVELIEGQIVKMNRTGTGHIWAVALVDASSIGGTMSSAVRQGTFELATWSGPEPDLVVLRDSAPQTNALGQRTRC